MNSILPADNRKTTQEAGRKSATAVFLAACINKQQQKKCFVVPWLVLNDAPVVMVVAEAEGAALAESIEKCCNPISNPLRGTDSSKISPGNITPPLPFHNPVRAHLTRRRPLRLLFRRCSRLGKKIFESRFVCYPILSSSFSFPLLSSTFSSSTSFPIPSTLHHR